MVSISVIMPAFNAQGTIEEAINSVIAQDFEDWELIIIDDGSKDKTLQIVTSFLNDNYIIKIICLKTNGGLPNARNKGISEAKGKFVAFLDSDDLWMPNKLSSQFNFHQRNPEIKISHTAYRMFNSNGMLRKPIREYFSFLYPEKRKLIPLLYARNSIGILTVMVDRNLLLQVGGFDCELWTMEDHDLWLRIAELNETFGFINKHLALYRISPLGITNKIGKYKKAYKTLIKKHKENIITYHALDKAMANYYCLFGANYFKRRNFIMSNMCFSKAIKSSPLSFTSIISVFYLLSSKLISLKND